MARTRRRVPQEWHSWNKDDDDNKRYEERCRRGFVLMPIGHPDERFEEVCGQKFKKWAKKRQARKNRLKAARDIREQLKDVDL